MSNHDIGNTFNHDIGNTTHGNLLVTSYTGGLKDAMEGDQCYGSEKEFVMEALKGTMNFTSLCAKYCISPKTGYKWKERFIQQGFEGLEELSRKPKTNPESLSEEEILAIIKIKN